MGLLGDSWDDPQTGAVMALASGLLGGGSFGQAFGRGIEGAQKAMLTANQLARQKKQDAMAEEEFGWKRDAQRLAAQKQQVLNSFLTGADQSVASYNTPEAKSAQEVGPEIPGVPRYEVPQSRGDVISQALLDPNTLAKLKLAGVDLVDVAALAKPKWENINGNLVNTNAPGFKGGFQPGLQVTPNGQAVVWEVDENGRPVVGAAPGSLQTVGAFQRQEQQIKNQNSLLPLDYVDSASGRPLGGNVDAYLNPQQQQGQQPASGQATQAQQERLSIIRSEYNKAVASGNQKDADALKREFERVASQTPVQPYWSAQSAPQPQQAPLKLQSKAEAEAANIKARGDAEKSVENQNKASDFKTVKDRMEVARTLLNAGPTESGVGAEYDKAYNYFGLGKIGIPNSGADIASGLSSAASWLTQNVPKAPGAQSDAELRTYQEAVGAIGDKTKPVSQRLQALKTAQDMIGVWESKQGNSSNQPQVKAIPLPANPKASDLKVGETYDTPRGVAVWDGFRFKKVQ